ncbi:MAG TPA: TatD family deoxyribonuclease [Desulfobulbus sp.]|nr:TatD family deoxyribonuclease [Desulfobulbus sp.]
MDAYSADLDLVLNRAADAGVSAIITIGIDAASSKQAVKLAERFTQIYAAVGIHPHDAANATEEDFKIMTELAAHDKVVGYGEIGLDYAKKYSPKKIQQQIFSRQLQLAKELNIPVIIHDREAHEDTLCLLQEHAPYPAGGIMHCFSGDMTLAEKIMDLGFLISIPGIVTFKNAYSLHEVAATLPLGSMLIETDGPFLTPVPYRGKRNEPGYIIHTAQKIAELAGIPLRHVAAATTANAQSIFKFQVMKQSNAL